MRGCYNCNILFSFVTTDDQSAVEKLSANIGLPEFISALVVNFNISNFIWLHSGLHIIKY